ncbi:MAG: hypothetical protein CM1200mP13_12700 [Candidatus Pelagibacterales bacterium]|nr:MAG: hypothetical protein CM1200mP13_12700 [Pelagibacterales bacterium]
MVLKLNLFYEMLLAEIGNVEPFQVDLNLPGRLDASYVDKDGTKKVPVMLQEHYLVL